MSLVGSTGEETPRATSKSMTTRLFLCEGQDVNVSWRNVDQQERDAQSGRGNGLLDGADGHLLGQHQGRAAVCVGYRLVCAVQ